MGSYPTDHSSALAMLYDPSTGTSAATGSLNTARESHTATLLPNGQVLAAGGANFPSDSDGIFTILARAELYAP